MLGGVEETVCLQISTSIAQVAVFLWSIFDKGVLALTVRGYLSAICPFMWEPQMVLHLEMMTR